jgi:hypothetical protein
MLHLVSSSTPRRIPLRSGMRGASKPSAPTMPPGSAMPRLASATALFPSVPADGAHQLSKPSVPRAPDRDAEINRDRPVWFAPNPAVRLAAINRRDSTPHDSRFRRAIAYFGRTHLVLFLGKIAADGLSHQMNVTDVVRRCYRLASTVCLVPRRVM